jgi:uncharacterized protein
MTTSEESIMFRSLPVQLGIRFVGVLVLCFLISFVGAMLSGSTPLPLIITKAIGLVLSIAALVWLCRLDKRTLEHAGLHVHQGWKSFLIGLGIGAALYTAIIVVAALAGLYNVETITFNAVALLSGFALLTIAASYEEILFRGVLLQGLEAGFGSWLAVVFSAILFGLLHASNSSATFTSILSVALAGFAFGLAFIKYRNLWLVSGIHLGWNFLQGPIYGVAVSGNEFSSLIQSTQQGSILLTGGAFGFEASLLTFLLVIVVSGLLMPKLTTVLPLWSSKQTQVNKSDL